MAGKFSRALALYGVLCGLLVLAACAVSSDAPTNSGMKFVAAADNSPYLSPAPQEYKTVLEGQASALSSVDTPAFPQDDNAKSLLLAETKLADPSRFASEKPDADKMAVAAMPAPVSTEVVSAAPETTTTVLPPAPVAPDAVAAVAAPSTPAVAPVAVPAAAPVVASAAVVPSPAPSPAKTHVVAAIDATPATTTTILKPIFVNAPTSSVSSQPAPATDHSTTDHAANMTGGSEYILGVGDEIKMTVYGEDDLSGTYQIGSTGVIALPLIGNVDAAGRSIGQFELAVRDKLMVGYLKDPRVSVQISNYRPFFILGEVAKPGSYPYVNGMTVLNAVALAGGYTYRADKSDDRVVRANDPTKTEKNIGEDAVVMPGDIVRVPERFF